MFIFFVLSLSFQRKRESDEVRVVFCQENALLQTKPMCMYFPYTAVAAELSPSCTTVQSLDEEKEGGISLILSPCTSLVCAKSVASSESGQSVITVWRETFVFLYKDLDPSSPAIHMLCCKMFRAIDLRLHQLQEEVKNRNDRWWSVTTICNCCVFCQWIGV